MTVTTPTQVSVVRTLASVSQPGTAHASPWMMGRAAWLLISCCCLPGVALAQSQDLPIPHAAAPFIDAFDKPLHPLVGGVAPGGGPGVGIGYDTPKDRNWFRNTGALVTWNRYWSVDGETGYRTHRSRIGLFGSARTMGRLDFFGLGPHSDFADHTNYRLRENVVGARGWFRPRAGVRIGGNVEIYKPQLGAGSSRDVPTIETRFSPSTVPGLDATPLFGRYRGLAELTYPLRANPNRPDGVDQGYQGIYQVAVESARDNDAGRYNFHRFETEVQQRFRGFRDGHRLTLHGLMAVTNPDAVVPFYLQYTLGGGGLSAFRSDTIGTDGTTKTLRAYDNYRFRDRDILLLQAEYRVPIRGPVQGTIFYDAGQVAPHVAGLFRTARQSTGFSVSMMRKGATLLRMDVGYGSGEGAHVFWGFGPLGP